MRAAKVDLNHGTIVSALRNAGVSVKSTAGVAGGFPDLVCAKGEKTWLIEIKGPKGKPTPEQTKFIAEWRGVVHICRSVDDALQVVGVSQVRDL